MKNIIYYYYNLKIDKITNKNNNYYFYYNNYLYYFIIYNNNPNIINDIYTLSLSIKNSPIHTIIKNKNNNYLTPVENILYILLKINYNFAKQITIKEINYITNLNYFPQKNLIRSNWNILWSKKIDYLENQIPQIGRKYPLLVDSFSYFVGLAENAISYYQNTILNMPSKFENDYRLAHDNIRLTSSTLDFFNPLNIIIDHKSRDLSEYIKISFFQQNYNIFEELDKYFKINFYTEYDTRLLISRLLYPSFYFNLYDDIINNIIKEKEIVYITKNINEYENYLKDILLYLEKYYKLPSIDWLTTKKRYN